jgi:hypothetical protein
MVAALNDERRDTIRTQSCGWFEVFVGSADFIG